MVFNFLKQKHLLHNELYNKILSLSRDKIFYTKFGLNDTFQNRIYLIFFHISFLLRKDNFKNKSLKHKEFDQKMFDITFNHIELDMRELGYGDTTVNKNMKLLIKDFYNILLGVEKYNQKKLNDKLIFFYRYLTKELNDKNPNNIALVTYFDKYQAFCLDLCLDNVLKGDLNFTYKYSE